MGNLIDEFVTTHSGVSEGLERTRYIILDSGKTHIWSEYRGHHDLPRRSEVAVVKVKVNQLIHVAILSEGAVLCVEENFVAVLGQTFFQI